MCKKIELEKLESHPSTFAIYKDLTTSRFNSATQHPLMVYHTIQLPNNWSYCTFPSCIEIATKRIENLPSHMNGLTCELHYNQFSTHIEQNDQNKQNDQNQMKKKRMEKLHTEQSTPKKRKHTEDLTTMPYRNIRPITDRTYVTRGRKAEEKQIIAEKLMIPLTILCDHACFLYEELLVESRKNLNN